MVKSFKFIVTTMLFVGLAGCVCERKMYRTNIKNDTQIHPQIKDKSMQDICSKKGDATNEEHHQTWSPKGRPETSKKDTKSITNFKTNDFVGVAVSPPRMPKNTYKSTRFRASCLHKYKNRRKIS